MSSTYAAPNPLFVPDARERLLGGLNAEQCSAVDSTARRLLVVAGAGSGKTEVMARRVAWWMAVDGIRPDRIVAFTFMEAAAEELKFRIRRCLEDVTKPGSPPILDGMYVGTIHGFCLRKLRELAPETYYNYDVCDELTRFSLADRAANFVLGIKAFQVALEASGPKVGYYESIRRFLKAYDLLHEYDDFSVELSSEPVPSSVAEEKEWCRKARLLTPVGTSSVATTFGICAARFYAYLRARRFLDFATSQSELTRLIRGSNDLRSRLADAAMYVVVDEVQDINPVQREIIDLFVGETGRLTAVGDHRQAVYSFRGRVEIMGELAAELDATASDDVLTLPENYRSTERIVKLANEWSKNIGTIAGLANPVMRHGNKGRVDLHERHVAIAAFPDRNAEANSIAASISVLVSDAANGATHDERGGRTRGLTYADVAILVRSGSGVREFQDALRSQGIPTVVRAGADLFAQPEVLLFLACFAKATGSDAFYGREMTTAIKSALGCAANADAIIDAACFRLRRNGLPLEADVELRLKALCSCIAYRLQKDTAKAAVVPSVSSIKTVAAKRWCSDRRQPRRVFPQTLLHWLLSEADIRAWDDGDVMKAGALFHLGQLSSLLKGLEIPGWTNAGDLKFQIVAFLNWGAKSARPDDAPLLVAPDAVTISTIHGAKGLEYPAVFLVDVNAKKFPSSYARQAPTLPFDGAILESISPAYLSDNANYDAERRLMYVALTRAERFLSISCSAASEFFKELVPIVEAVGGTVGFDLAELSASVRTEPSSRPREDRLATSFSDLRFHFECPHDFYLRKVLGFAPAIDQAFGYGRAVHNLLQQIHTDPKTWSRLSPAALRNKLDDLVRSPGFYLRYTTGEPLDNLRAAAAAGLARYIDSFRSELASLSFEPEREFETLIAEENVMISGAIDLVRLDAPPRVTIVDFKSGSAKGDDGSLSREMMELQLGVYALAAISELQYSPEHGQVRFLGEPSPEKRNLDIDFSESRLQSARDAVVDSARSIRRRDFRKGPMKADRCVTCDHVLVCGMRR